MSATTGRDIAEEMAKRGHTVTVIASFPNRPTGKLYPNYRRSWRSVEHRDGYELIHCWHTLSTRPTLVSRLAENISFGVTSTLQMAREPGADVVYMNTWPLFAQWLNTCLLCRRGVPVICSVKDLYPESLVGSEVRGATRLVASLALAVDRQVHRRSAVIAPLNPIMAEYIVATRSVPEKKVRVVYDWVDAAGVPRDQPKWNSFRQRQGAAPDTFLAMYVGSMTRMAGLQLYVDAAELLRDRQDIRLLLVGDGSMRGDLESQIERKGLKNVELIYPLEPEQVPEVQAAADVLLLSLLPGGAEHALPSKLIHYLFSQRPVVASVEGDGPPARIIREAQCGYVVSQGNARELADRLVALADDRSSLQDLGENARRFADEHFLKENALRHACDLIEEVGNRAASTE